MNTLRVKKIVAVCFLEAVKMTLDHIGAYRLEMDRMGVEGSPELTRLYGECRRHRDYIQASICASPEEVELDFGPEDICLLVACCRRLVDGLDQKIGTVLPGKERSFLEKKRQLVVDWTVELAAKPLIELPMPPVARKLGDGAMQLRQRLSEKLFPVHKQSIIRSGTMRAITPQAIAPVPPPSPPQPSPPVAQEPAASVAPPPQLVDDYIPSDPLLAMGLPGGMAVDPVPNDELLDSAVMREPRLRSLVALDLRSLRHAEEKCDYRIATVMLTSILEAVVIDYAIPRRAELGLGGTPDSWCPQEILLEILGDRATANDRAFAYTLFFARNLLKPAVQLVSPAVATVASVQRTREFVEHCLHQLGYRSATRAAYPSQPSSAS